MRNISLKGLSRIAFLGAAFVLTQTARADEGMWVYNNLPKETLKSRYGFSPTDAWANHLMKSSVRFNSGGSGSFISENGLVITNHHVASDTLQKLSTAAHNYYSDGFYAKTNAEEAAAPDLELNQLISIEDVTDRVNNAVKPTMTADESNQARRSVIAQIEKESTEKTGLRSDVMTLYQGGQYQLYRYKKYTDVRLVFAPEFGIAFFGGDNDNFEYPRYDLDIAIFRVYENGKPAKITDYLKWSDEGAKADELVFVSGHPGRTSRLFTTAALKYLRDTSVPYTLNLLRRREIMLQQYSGKGAEQARQAKNALFSVQNSRKVYVGQIAGLQDKNLLLAKQREEYELRSKVMSDPTLKAYGSAWDTIAQTQNIMKKNLVRYSLLEGGTGFYSSLFGIARTLVRMADEDKKPNDKRLPEFRDSGRASLEQSLFSTAPIYPEFEIYKLANSLSFLVEKLGNDDSLVKLILQGRDPQTRARELVEGTILKDVSVRKLIARDGKKGIQDSYDPMLELAMLVDGPSRNIRKLIEDKAQEPQRQAYAQIAKVIFATKGTNTYPDATFTLRLSFGTVKGYEENGTKIDPITTMGGAYTHAAAHGSKDPYELPKSWLQHKADINLSTPFNFVSTADIIGGNSGSPVVNRDGQFVGIIFDGNIHSLLSDYVYTETQNRAVAVHSSAITESLTKIYGATDLVKEIGK